MKLGTKIGTGFGIVTMVAIALGTTGYVMFSRVDTNVGRLANHSLPAVKNATGVERSALQCLLNQKDFLLSNKDEYKAKQDSDLAQLNKSLDEVDKIAAAHNDVALATKSQEVRKIVAEYGKLFNLSTETIGVNKLAEQTLNAKGLVVAEESDAYMAAKKAEYLEAKKALALVNEVGATTLRTRLHAVRYMLNKNQKDFEAMEKNTASLLASYGELEKLHPDATETKQIAEARKATSDYFDAAKVWVAEQKRDDKSAQLAELYKNMTTTGEQVGRITEEYLTAKQTKVDTVADAVFIVSEIAQRILSTRLNMRVYIAYQDEKSWKTFNEHIARLDTLYDSLRKVSLTPEDLQRIDRADKATQDYLTTAREWAANDSKIRQTVLPQLRTIGDTVLTDAQTAENDAWKASDAASTNVTAIVSSSKLIIVIALLIGAVVACTAAVVITRSITKPINRIIAGLNEGADQVNDASGQVSSASQSLAEGASEQASSLEETSSALEQMAAMTRTNAANADKANEMMIKTRAIVTDGNSAMNEASAAMSQISEASEQISKIIKVIEEIAFQTNLLALNAAVEAARAGEHGKGFAVVADEVRNLAQRAASAAKETGDLIDQTVQRVAHGVELNKTTSESFAKIGESANAVAELVAQIARASNEQAQGVDQVNTAVAQMDKITQQNASSAEESASASEELAAQAQAVKGMVGELIVLVGGHDHTGNDPACPQSVGRAGNNLKRPQSTRIPRPVRRQSIPMIGTMAGKAQAGLDDLRATQTGSDSSIENLNEF